jgi:hypothetical protein
MARVNDVCWLLTLILASSNNSFQYRNSAAKHYLRLTRWKGKLMGRDRFPHGLARIYASLGSMVRHLRQENGQSRFTRLRELEVIRKSDALGFSRDLFCLLHGMCARPVNDATHRVPGPTRRWWGLHHNRRHHHVCCLVLDPC